MKQIIVYIGVAAVLSLTACNDSFLERSPQSINDKTFWNTPSDLEAYVNNFYSWLPSGVTSIADGESDDQVPNGISQYFWGQYTTPTPEASSWCNWSKGAWEPIRLTNYFMTHYKTVVGSEADINKYVGENRFFRALQYAGLMRTFGDLPWVDKELGTDSPELYDAKLKRYEIMDKIIEDFDFAIQWLPEKPAAGRIGKDVARHLKARTCLHEATYYRYHTELGWQDKAERLLKLAADETDAIINSGRYEIYNTGKPEKDYYEMFVIEDKSNLKEAILPVTYLDGKRKHGMSRTLWEANTGFSKDFMEGYLCKDGKPISLSSYYKGDDNMRNETADRDPRLKQTVLTWDFPTRVTVSTNDSTFITEESKFIDQYCYTGYKSIKYFIPTDKAFEANNNTYDGIAYRYAETLLINAEAKAELGTISQVDLDKTINVLRDRVGMPHLTTNVGFTDPNWTKWGYELSPLLQEIRRERRVELAGEGRRWDDLMRWKAGKICDNIKTYVGKRQPEKGGKYAIVYPNYTNEDYSYEAGKSRTWDDRLYLRPIPTAELQRNPNLLPQNPGWDK